MVPLTRFLAVVLLTLGLGCSLPDLGPFAQSTASLEASARKVDASVTRMLEELAKRHPQEVEFAKFKLRFSKAWEMRLALMEVLVDYSEALEGIAKAGQNGEAGARSLVDSINEVARGLGQAGAVAGLAAELAGKIYGLISTGLAHNNLEDAMNSADKAIQSVASTVVQDLGELNAAMEAAVKLIVEDIKEDSKKRLNNIDVREKLASLSRKEIEWVKALEDATLGGGDDRGKKIAEAKARLEEHRVLTKEYERWAIPLEAEINEMTDAGDSLRRLLEKMNEGISRWGKSHRSMAKALKEDRTPNVALLLRTTSEIKAILEERKKKP